VYIHYKLEAHAKKEKEAGAGVVYRPSDKERIYHHVCSELVAMYSLQLLGQSAVGESTWLADTADVEWLTARDMYTHSRVDSLMVGREQLRPKPSRALVDFAVGKVIEDLTISKKAGGAHESREVVDHSPGGDGTVQTHARERWKKALRKAGGAGVLATRFQGKIIPPAGNSVRRVVMVLQPYGKRGEGEKWWQQRGGENTETGPRRLEEFVQANNNSMPVIDVSVLLNGRTMEDARRAEKEAQEQKKEEEEEGNKLLSFKIMRPTSAGQSPTSANRRQEKAAASTNAKPAISSKPVGLHSISRATVMAHRIRSPTGHAFGHTLATWSNDLVLETLMERLAQTDCEGGFILIGFPRSVTQAKTFDRILQQSGEQVWKIVAVVPQDKQSRMRNQPLQQYCDHAMPIVDYYKGKNHKGLRTVGAELGPKAMQASVEIAVSSPSEPELHFMTALFDETMVTLEGWAKEIHEKDVYAAVATRATDMMRAEGEDLVAELESSIGPYARLLNKQAKARCLAKCGGQDITPSKAAEKLVKAMVLTPDPALAVDAGLIAFSPGHPTMHAKRWVDSRCEGCHRGKLVLNGGGTTAGLHARIVKLAGGKQNAVIGCVFMTACSINQQKVEPGATWAETWFSKWNDAVAGFRAAGLPMSRLLLIPYTVDNVNQRDSEEYIDIVRRCTAIYMPGDSLEKGKPAGESAQVSEPLRI
jgi:adenylate kinase family enzyme